jgi:acetylornithine/succinyldiaminopimelate/putrescine aminotransferase
VKGDGALVFDSRGNKYVDLDNNYSATNPGNANSEIALGLFNQASLLVSQKEDRIQVARARFLKEFQGFLPEGLECFYWQNSGGEAVDKSLKIAKAYTGHTGLIATEGGFHGRTHGAVAVTHNPAYRAPFGLDHESWVHFAKFGDLDAVATMLERGLAKTVIVELVQGEEAGIRPAGNDFA